VMDAVEDVLADGRGSPALAGFLERAGFRFLLLRGDIDRAATGAPPANVIRAGLAASAGVRRVAAFGPLEVYEVASHVPLVTAVSTSDVPTVSGGPESLLPLLESGVLSPSTPTVLAGDGGLADSREWLVTDGLRHRERNVGRMRDNLSQTLTDDEQPRQDRPSTDVLPFQGRAHLTTAAYRGVRGVTASTSVAFADAAGASDPSGLPFAAVDGDPLTSWRSSSQGGPAGQWLEVELDTPRTVPYVELSIVDDIRVGWPVTRIRLTTDSGSVDHEVASGGQAQRFTLPAGVTSRVRVTVLSVAADRDNGNVGVAELTIPGVTPHRALVTPADALPDMNQRTNFVFTRGSQPRYACVGGTCDPALTRAGEEPDGLYRLFNTTSAANYRLEGTVLPALGGRDPVSLPGVEVSATTQLADDPAAGALSAVDGNASTAWRPDVRDLRPTLRLSWATPQQLEGLRLTGTRLPTDVEITVPQGTQTVPVRDGVARFELTTNAIEIRLIGGSGAVNELRLLGMDLPAPPADFTVPCGQGPTIVVDGFTYETSVSGTLADYVAHRPLRFQTCADSRGGLDLPAGRHEARTERADSFVVQDLWLLSGSPWQARTRPATVTRWDTTHRSVRVGAGASAVLTVPENANSGWVATLDGRTLPKVRVDGWQQAWVVPAGSGGEVTMEFTPDGQYRQSLLIGGLTAVALVVSLLIPVRGRRAISVRAGGERWVPIALVVLLAVLGGMLPIVLLIACLLARTLWPPAPRWLAVGGAGIACLVAVSGRVLRNGQEWAHGTAAQALLLLAVAAVVAGYVDWFAPRPELDQRTRARERPRGDDGGGDDLRQLAVQPAGHEHDLDRDGAPDEQR